MKSCWEIGLAHYQEVRVYDKQNPYFVQIQAHLYYAVGNLLHVVNNRSRQLLYIDDCKMLWILPTQFQLCDNFTFVAFSFETADSLAKCLELAAL